MCIITGVMYVRKKKVKGYTYYYLVEGELKNKKVKQKVVKYLGSAENILGKFKFWEENH